MAPPEGLGDTGQEGHSLHHIQMASTEAPGLLSGAGICSGQTVWWPSAQASSTQHTEWGHQEGDQWYFQGIIIIIITITTTITI